MKRICDVTEFGRLSYNINYRKTFEIEIINELQSAIHSKMLNFVLNNEFDKSDSKNLQTNLLNQLSNMNQINLFKL
ncbi:hypothetical protein ACXOSR_08990, partial [Streptococcus thermophilus]